MGNLYKEGFCVERDSTEAAHWYKLAAENGNPEAQLALALCYIFGNGVQKSDTNSYMWFLLALNYSSSDKIKTDCNKGLKILAKYMSNRQITIATQNAKDMDAKIKDKHR